MDPTIKQEIYERCQEYVNERIESCRKVMADLQQSANQETKSSSGDKYETGRAMAQLEIEKSAQQLNENLKLKLALDQLRIDAVSSTVQAGSLVRTDQEMFFIAIGLGKLTVQSATYYVIAPISPLGLKLMGSRVGDRVAFRDKIYAIREIV